MALVLGVRDRRWDGPSRFSPLPDHVVVPGDEAASFSLLVLVGGVDLLRILDALASGMFSGGCHCFHLLYLPLLAGQAPASPSAAMQTFCHRVLTCADVDVTYRLCISNRRRAERARRFPGSRTARRSWVH